VRDGPSGLAPITLGVANQPAWPSWIAARAPSAWIASVKRRSPGITSSRIQSWSAKVRPSADTEQ
jgi:hypothetical protein